MEQEFQIREYHLYSMHCNLLETVMSGEEQALQMELTVQDLRCRFMQDMEFHFHIMQLHSRDMVQESAHQMRSREICFSMEVEAVLAM